MKLPAANRVWGTACILALGYLIATLVTNLSAFPGLHGDEAWRGLDALRLLAGGSISPHAMNTYTGPIHSMLIAAGFALISPDVLALRLPGVLANIAAFLLLALVLAKHRSSRASFIFVAGVLTSMLLVYYARVAWEVTALHTLLLAVSIAAIHEVAGSDRAPRWTSALFLGSALIGGLSHFIYFCVSFSFALAGAFLFLLRPTRRTAHLLFVSGSGALIAAVLYLVKPKITALQWNQHSVALTLSACALPVVLTIALHLRPTESLRDLLVRIVAPRSKPAIVVGIVLVTGLLGGLQLTRNGFVAGFIETMGNTVLHQRIASYLPPASLSMLNTLFAWLACLAAFVASCANLLRWKTRSDGLLVFSLVFVLLGPGFWLAGLVTSSIRYFLVPSLLLIWILTMTIDDLARPWLRRFSLSVLLVIAATNAVAWIPITSSNARPPLTFKIGNLSETSAHFMPLAYLRENAERHQACLFTGNFFLRMPLKFYQATRRWACKRGLAFAARYCRTCTDSQYLAFELRQR
ncbi:MAG: hypothetical protein H6707_02560 [Deltaproteobacteria bacterium]|nr:hypothetical protein [Deltaproteobacteria bacterium]